MFAGIRKRITYTNVALTIGLVFAMTGGAYAASKYVITSTKQISPSVLKKLTGKTGAKGANGANGTPGATGPQGPAGAAGAKGEPGTPGAAGKDGAPGEKGPKGATGSPWTAGGTLPTEATETGAWTMGSGNTTPSAGFGISELEHASISFTIPLAKPLDEKHVQSNPMGYPTGATTEQTEHCPGTAAEPKAKAGYLCVYTGDQTEMQFTAPLAIELNGTENAGANTSGAMLANATRGTHAYGVGSWAVTGE